MVKAGGEYRHIVAEIVLGRDSMGRPKPQVRPIPGQGLDTSLNIECARRLREVHPIGTKFRMQVKLTDMEGTPFLYSHHGWRVEVLPNQ